MAENDHISVEDRGLDLRQIVDLSPALLHSARPDGYLDFFNQTWLDFTGATLKELLGWGWTSFIHPDDVEGLVRSWRDSLNKGVSFQESSRVRRADGVYRWMFHQKVPSFGRNGSIVKWHGSSVDIDDRKKTEELLVDRTRELQRSEMYLSEAQRLGHIGSWVFNPRGSFEYWSDELFRIYGLDISSGSPSLDKYLSCVHPNDRDFMANLIKRMLAEELGCDVTKRIVRAGGEVRYVRCIGAPVIENGTLKRIVGNAIDVTEHELLTQERIRREAYLTEAQNLSCTGSFGWNINRNTIKWSTETYRIFEIEPDKGVTPEDIVARVHPEDRELVLEATKNASTNGRSFDLKHRLLFPDGRVKFIRVLARPLEVESDSLEFVGAIIDITEAKRAEELLQNSEKDLRDAIDTIPAVVWIALPDGSNSYVNRRFVEYSGRQPEDMAGDGWYEAIHPDDLQRFRDTWLECVHTGRPFESELRFRRADGQYLWHLQRGVPLRDGNGNIVKWYGVVFDVSALKETEHALQVREHELRGIIDTIPSMLWSLSPAGEVTYCSQRILEYHGCSSLKQFVELGWGSFIHPDDLQESAKEWFRAIATGESFNAIHRMRRADGEYRWFHARGEALRDPEGKIIQWYGLSVDIDERKRAEDHLRDTHNKLAMASRVATVAELAASIAHELNQPLMSISANAQAANRWLGFTPSNTTEVKTSIERILRDARIADETIRHIRALFKQESFVKRDVMIPDIIREVVRIVQEDPKKREVPIEFHFEKQLPSISIDPIQIQQVFINLIVNAIEAMEGQQVSPLVSLHAVKTDSNSILIRVVDNGPGVMDPERIFDAFMTTKEKGMGIGLAVSRTIVEAHGGRLWAVKNKDRGASFNVTLPLASENY